MRAALLALAVYFVLIALAAVLVTSGTATLDTRNSAWVAANLACGLVAGFVGARFAMRSPVWVRYAAGVSGPALLALVFALTTDARDESGVWLAFAASVGGAAAGAAVSRFSNQRSA
jgi:peptidoglycan/LPS O-acetylase OafA/YrhL